MDHEADISASLANAFREQQPVHIQGGGSKAFYANPVAGEPLNVSAHSGIIDFDRSRCELRVRAGTTLDAIEQFLAGEQHYMAFEPAAFSETSSIGGSLACGWSGSARPFNGAARDYVLGCRMLNGRGQLLSLGASYDNQDGTREVAQLMVGSMGCFGVLLEVCLRTRPLPEQWLTLALPSSYNEAFDIMNARAGMDLPLQGLAFDGDSVLQRVAGSAQELKHIGRRIAGDVLQQGEQFWRELNQQTHYFFQYQQPLWRLSLKSSVLPIGVPGYWLIDWGGALRWLQSNEPEQHIRDALAQEGGHATLFRAVDKSRVKSVFQPLPAAQQQRLLALKRYFDPAGILNIGIFYKGI